MKKTLSILIYMLLVAAVLCGIALLFMYIDNGESNFYVAYGNSKIAHNAENLELRKDEINVFYCKKILGVTDEQERVSAKDYAVTVQPNKQAISDFAFRAVGISRQRFYDYEMDYAAGFDISVNDGFFTLYMPTNYTMSDYLNHIYGQTVYGIGIDLSDIKLYEKDCFQIVVRYIPDNTTTTIGFH